MRFEIYTDAEGDWRWRMVALNGKVVADSAEGYKRLADCEHGIGLLRDYALGAEIVREGAK